MMVQEKTGLGNESIDVFGLADDVLLVGSKNNFWNVMRRLSRAGDSVYVVAKDKLMYDYLCRKFEENGIRYSCMRDRKRTVIHVINIEDKNNVSFRWHGKKTMALIPFVDFWDENDLVRLYNGISDVKKILFSLSDGEFYGFRGRVKRIGREINDVKHVYYPFTGSLDCVVIENLIEGYYEAGLPGVVVSNNKYYMYMFEKCAKNVSGVRVDYLRGIGSRYDVYLRDGITDVLFVDPEDSYLVDGVYYVVLLGALPGRFVRVLFESMNPGGLVISFSENYGLGNDYLGFGEKRSKAGVVRVFEDDVLLWIDKKDYLLSKYYLGSVLNYGFKKYRVVDVNGDHVYVQEDDVGAYTLPLKRCFVKKIDTGWKKNDSLRTRLKVFIDQKGYRECYDDACVDIRVKKRLRSYKDWFSVIYKFGDGFRLEALHSLAHAIGLSVYYNYGLKVGSLGLSNRYVALIYDTDVIYRIDDDRVLGFAEKLLDAGLPGGVWFCGMAGDRMDDFEAREMIVSRERIDDVEFKGCIM